jgi:selenocysteine-specific elongation factor
METRHFIIGTAGHIDHGKSSLVRALTGTDPDRLPEEKARGMTIDLGFAHLVLDDAASGIRCDVGIVDVPGHADFVKNMVAGVGSIDAVILVVAADDGWMPQTEEHLQILDYLGVRNAVVALTKSDLTEDLKDAIASVRHVLQDSPFADAAIVPVAAPHGIGLDDLRAALVTMLRSTPPPADIGKPRLPVDRVFSRQGIGTVVTGTLTGGKFPRGGAAVVQPHGQATHLRGLQHHHSSVETATPGRRTAVNLADVAVAEREHRSGVARGDVVTLPSLGSAHDTLDVVIACSSRESRGDRPLRNGQKVVWHHGSAGIEARLYLQGVRQLDSGASAPAQLRFRGKVYAFSGDRFVLRDVARQRTLAGGLVIDPDAGRAHFRKPKFRACLETCAANAGDPAILMAALLARDGARLRESLLLKSRWSAGELETAAAGLTRAGTLRAEGPWLIDCAWWESQVAAAGSLIRSWHRARPELPGLDAAEFQSQAAGLLPDKRLLDPLTASLAAVGFIRSGRHFRHIAHRPALPPQLQASGARLRAALARNPVEPPGIAELITSPLDRQALKFLCDTGEAVQLDEKAVLLSDALESLKETITSHLAKTGGATASDLRTVTSTTRRILIPLLERMDREGLTRRDGDFRRLRQPPPPDGKQAG